MVVYLAITALVVLFTMQWAVSAMMHYRRITHHSSRIIAMTCATDVWMRDMRSATGPLYNHHDTWLWCIGDTYVAWYLKDHALIRAEGSYSHTVWHERIHTLMAEEIELLDIHYEPGMASIRIEGTKGPLSETPYHFMRMVHTYV
jgi:hypothetical protein